MTSVLGVHAPSPSSSSAGVFVSAPGKIILFGEHAVVYGRTAVAGSLDLRTYVSLFTSADGRIFLSLPDLGVEKTWMLKDLTKAVDKLADTVIDDGGPPSLELLVPLARKLSGSCEDQCGVQHLAILAFWYILLGIAQRKRDMLAVKLTVRFKLPSCVGLGSSGAYCVCITTALLQAASLIPKPSVPVDGDSSTWDDQSLDMIRKWSSAAESLIHGRASGLDAAVCTYGGVASFRPGQRIVTLRNLPDLRVILVNSKVERNTSRMVASVKERKNKFPEVVNGIFDAIDAISREAVKLLNRPEDECDGEVMPMVLEGRQSDGSSRLSVAALNRPTENGSATSSASTSTQMTSSAPAEHQSLQKPAGHRLRSDAASKRSSSASISSDGPDADTFMRLNDLCRMNNQLLIALGVGHPKIDQISTLLARYGIHPKMTGAGGGGSLFAFLKPDTSQTVMDMISEELTKLGYELWQPQLGGAGVTLHHCRPAPFATPQRSPVGSVKR